MLVKFGFFFFPQGINTSYSLGFVTVVVEITQSH